MQSIELLIQNMKQLALDLQLSPHKGKEIEIASCFLYVKIWELCLKKAKRNKHEKFILDEFNMCDRKRLDFKADGQDDDAFIEAIKQEAYRQAWEAAGLPPGILVKKKRKPFFMPLDATPHFGMKMRIGK